MTDLKEMSNEELLNAIERAIAWNNRSGDYAVNNFKTELLSRLEQAESLRCCGNCTIYEAGSNVCPVDQFGTREGWEYCEKWESDNFAQKDRMQEDYNGGN